MKSKKKLQNILFPTAMLQNNKSGKNAPQKSQLNLDNINISMDVGGLLLANLNPGSPRLAQMGMLFLPGEYDTKNIFSKDNSGFLPLANTTQMRSYRVALDKLGKLNSSMGAIKNRLKLNN